MGLILFVCTGNLCRSPMAAGLLRKKLADRGQEGLHRVRSAGVWAVDGHPASANSIQVMDERGIDIADHVSHTISAEDVAEADLILAMSREHVEMLRTTWPQYEWKMFRLSEMSGKRRDVVDPYTGPIEEYRACADLIDGYIDRGLTRILELS